MTRFQFTDLKPSEVLFRALPAIALAASLAMVMSGCGVKQFGAKLVAPASNGKNAFGPFYSSGQGDGSMSTTTCAAGAGHHPCARARASVGMPYQFDANPNTVGGQVVSGTNFSSLPYSGTAGPSGTGAGKSAGGVHDRASIENRDMRLMQRQTASGN